MNSVEEKMSMMNIMPPKKNDTKMNKRLGVSGAEIKYLGKSNQKIRRRLG
jgi:hypothetical protein